MSLIAEASKVPATLITPLDTPFNYYLLYSVTGSEFPLTSLRNLICLRPGIERLPKNNKEDKNYKKRPRHN
jgi:hypothetical protein